jgi:hypothetical protein
VFSLSLLTWSCVDDSHSFRACLAASLVYSFSLCSLFLVATLSTRRPTPEQAFFFFSSFRSFFLWARFPLPGYYPVKRSSFNKHKMHFSSSFLVAVGAAISALVVVEGAPALTRRAASDILVFKFADVLEQLESEFYSQALAKFKDADFQAAGFTASEVAIQQFTSIQSDEATHSTVLQAALKSFGETPITSCSFNFDSALTDVATMAAVARVVEFVGVGAYLGGATLLTDPVLLTSAGSILTVEARHQTILNVLSGAGTAIPAAFDLAMTPSEVLALAAPFFKGPCDLGIPANPVLSLTNTGAVGVGTLLTFSSAALNGTTDGLFCQMLLPGQPTSISLPLSNCVVPQINGPVAVFITSDSQPLTNNVRDRATTQLVAGPILAFIDTQPQALGSLARGLGSASGGAATTTATRTISPSEASSIVAGASSTGAPAPDATSATASGAATSVPALVSVGGASSGGPNTETGPSADGTITVMGWSNIPAGSA